MVDISPLSQEYVNTHRRADDVLVEWSRVRSRITNMLIDTPVSLVRKLWEDPRLVGVARYCDRNNSLLKCNPCTLVAHLVKLDEYGRGIVEQGALTDTYLMAQWKHDMVNFISIVEHQDEYIEMVMKKLKDVTCEEFSSHETLHIASDRFTNDVLISWMLEDIMRMSHLQHYLKLYNFYICAGTGMTIRDDCTYYNIKALHDAKGLDTDMVRGIIGQLLVVYSVLAPYQFVHGSATVKSLKFEDEVHSLAYQGKKVKCPVTVKLCHFQDSGLTIARSGQEEDLLNGKVVGANDRLRLYPHNHVIADSITLETLNGHEKIIEGGMPVIPELAVHIHGDVGEVRRFTYENAANFLRFYRHSGVPIYRDFDLICFFCSLMSYQPFHDVVMGDEKLKQMWTGLWREDDFVFISKHIQNLHDQRLALVKTLDVAKMLVDIEIRCDVLEHLWDQY